jgi:hypothetical protein
VQPASLEDMSAMLGSQHCSSQHCGSHHCGAASCHAAPVLGRVETKIFLLVFMQKFREKFSSFLRKKFTKIFLFRESFHKNTPFGMRIRIQEPTECASRSEYLWIITNNHLKNFVLELLRKKQIFTKKQIFAEAKMFAKNENYLAPCDYGSATLLSDIVISCNFNMLMKSVSWSQGCGF